MAPRPRRPGAVRRCRRLPRDQLLRAQGRRPAAPDPSDVVEEARAAGIRFVVGLTASPDVLETETLWGLIRLEVGCPEILESVVRPSQEAAAESAGRYALKRSPGALTPWRVTSVSVRRPPGTSTWRMS